ncbi:hypothetical protein NUW58_g4599 [Xylaria curta]|uniref:Uncharacterized protein n=1 Tax=Xylaria curta TaxID=42375 RepID=A0ACC1P669_9PEZI|nr:hypothetical protein NUW58_g4599 [Xylaria curta]
MPSILLVLLYCFSSIVQASFFDDFVIPEVQYRPKFRYWLPDASADVDAVVQDVANIAAVGAGGLEFLPYYQLGPQPTNWSEYGFGSEPHRIIFRAVMKAAAEHKVQLDFSVGGNQGQGVPSEPEEVGLALELAYVNVSIPASQFFNGTLPLSTQPTNPELYFMYALEEFGQQNLSIVLGMEVLAQSDSSSGTVAIGRVIDLSDKVDRNTRSITWAAPSSDEGNTWRLAAWYERYTNQRSISGGQDPLNFVQNGSWIVDHFSAAGARKMTNFFDDYVVPEVADKGLLSRVSKYAWEDSMEMNAALWWTASFAEVFRASRGYEINTCLPFLIKKTTIGQLKQCPEGCNDDYRTVLLEAYSEYLKVSVEWAHSKGIEYRNQPAYNLPLNLLDSVSLVDAPEGESFGFDDNPDLYRHIAGPAHMAEIPVVSSECGALRTSAYSGSLRDLLWHIRRGLATGITMNVIHGFGYSGPFVNTTWPGFTTFSYIFTDMWGPRMPVWRHVNDTIAYTSRNQYLAQVGKPRVDLAFYQYAAPFDKLVYEGNNLEDIGFTYDYIGPASLSEEIAIVKDGILARDGPAYKGLVFDNQTKITVAAARQVKTFAEAGLPIFIIGEPNFSSPGRSRENAAIVESTMAQVLAMNKSVTVLSSASELPAALATLEVCPRVLFSDGEAAQWYSFWRSTDEAEFAFLYNGGNRTGTEKVTFEGVVNKVPYVIDAWTGLTRPLLLYSSEDANMIIPVTLGPDQTIIIAFIHQDSDSLSIPAPPSSVATTVSSGVKSLAYVQTESGNHILAHLSSGQSSIKLSSGKTLNYTASPPAPLQLNSWNVTIQEWHSTDDKFSMETAITIHAFPNSKLVSWKNLDPEALTNASGIADYVVGFTTPASGNAHRQIGAQLHLGAITDSVRVWMNGDQLPPIDVTRASDMVLDISNYLAPEGKTNQLRVELASTLYNYVRTNADEIWTFGVPATLGNSAYYEANPPLDYGLVGPVWVEWLEIVEVV